MPTATMGVSSVDRLARSKRPTVERTEIHIPPAPTFPVEAVTGDPRMRVQAVAAFNNAIQKWRNDAWSIEAPFVPDAELQADVAKLEDTTAKLVTKLDRAAVDIRRAEANITTISTNVTNIDNSITTIDNQITVIESNSITGTGIVQANGTNPPTAILGSTGHFPYWQPTDPYLSATSPIYLSAGFIGIGTVGPATELDVVGVVNASTGFRVNNLAVAGTVLRSNGTNYIGGQVVLTTDVTGLLPTANGGTNNGNYTAGSVIFAGAGGTSLTEDNANLFWDDANNRLGVGIAVPIRRLHVPWKSGDTVGTAIFGASTAGNNQIAIEALSNSVSAISCTSTSSVGISAFSTTGLAGAFYVTSVAAANAVVDVITLRAATTGLSTTNFGTGMKFITETSANDNRESARIQAVWTDATDATRTSALQFQTVNSAAALATGMAVTGLGQVRFGQSITLTVSALYGALITNASAASNGLIITNGIGSDFGQIAAGLYDFVTFAGTNAFQNAHGVYALTRNATTSASSNIQGAVFGFASNSTAASRANILIGGKFTVESESTGGTIAVFTAVDAVMSAVGIGQTITAAYGLRVNNLVNAGTITNTYGVHVGDITTGTQTNVPYSFISTDANARQSFAGNTGMGGGLSVGDSLTTMTLGVVNATVGYRIAGAAASGTYLRGNGTNFIGSVISPSDITYAFTEGSVLFAGPGGTTISQDNAAFFWDNTNNFLGLGTAVPLVLLHLNTAGFNDTSILFENANGYAAIELDGPTGDFKVSSLFGELQFVAGNQVHLSMDGVGNTLVVSGSGTISGYFSAAGNVGIGTNATAPGALLDLGLAGTTLGVMRMAGSTSGNVTIQAQAIAGTWTLQLPIDDGAAGSILTSNGSGVSAWTTILPIANGGTNANAFGTTEGVVYFDGTRLVNSADLFYSGSELVSRGVSLNGINEPYAARNINTGANAGTGYEAEVADTSNNLITAGYITWFKEQSWTTVAATQDSSATIGTTLNGATIAAILLHSSGSVVCGKDATGTTRTDDFTYICQTNGVPTGVPTAFGNRVAMTFDPNTDTFYIYRGGWKGVVVV